MHCEEENDAAVRVAEEEEAAGVAHGEVEEEGEEEGHAEGAEEVAEEEAEVELTANMTANNGEGDVLDDNRDGTELNEEHVEIGGMSDMHECQCEDTSTIEASQEPGASTIEPGTFTIEASQCEDPRTSTVETPQDPGTSTFEATEEQSLVGEVVSVHGLQAAPIPVRGKSIVTNVCVLSSDDEDDNVLAYTTKKVVKEL